MFASQLPDSVELHIYDMYYFEGDFVSAKLCHKSIGPTVAELLLNANLISLRGNIASPLTTRVLCLLTDDNRTEIKPGE